MAAKRVADLEKLVRLQILVPGDQKQRMRRLAKRSKCSVSEIYRRAADAYVESDGDAEIDNPELETLVEALEAGLRRANKATDRAEREVRATLDFYEARAEAREARQ